MRAHAPAAPSSTAYPAHSATQCHQLHALCLATHSSTEPRHSRRRLLCCQWHATHSSSESGSTSSCRMPANAHAGPGSPSPLQYSTVCCHGFLWASRSTAFLLLPAAFEPLASPASASCLVPVRGQSLPARRRGPLHYVPAATSTRPVRCVRAAHPPRSQRPFPLLSRQGRQGIRSAQRLSQENQETSLAPHPE